MPGLSWPRSCLHWPRVVKAGSQALWLLSCREPGGVEGAGPPPAILMGTLESPPVLKCYRLWRR